MLEGEFIDGVVQDKNFVFFLQEFLKSRVFHDGFLAFSSQEVDTVLSGLHSFDIIIETG